MGYEKIKDEIYRNVGGINEKASEYVTGENEVLDLANLSFQKPGAWSSRPGYSLYVNTSLVSKITGIYEYQKLGGASWLMIGAGNTLTAYSGTSAVISDSGYSGSPLDFITFQDTMLAANGNKYEKFNGSYFTAWGLPPLLPDSLAGITFNVNFIATIAATVAAYVFNFVYVNDRGILGPAIGGQNAVAIPATFGFGMWEMWGFTIPPGFGISYLGVYMKSETTVPPGINSVLGPSLVPFSLTSVAGGTFYYSKFFHFTAGASLLLRSADPNLGAVVLNDFLGVSVSGLGITYYLPYYSPSNVDNSYGIGQLTQYPRFQELYNNMVFMGGFSSTPSVTKVSEVGEFEQVAVESFFETRTNDGDSLTGYVSYQGNVVIFKERSISVVNGDSPDTLSQQEVTTDYGCVNNRAIIKFQSRLFFLDIKGICEFNGINTDIASNRIESTMKRLNLSIARDTAHAIHIKERNEVWFAIPLDTSTVNNAVVVYDYLVDGWTIYENFSPYSMFVGTVMLPKRNVFWGSHTGQVFAFGESLASDAGATITIQIKTKFHKRLGESTQELWRRWYLNNDIASVTTPVTLDWIPNYQTGVSLTRTIYLDQFQTRVETGLSAKSMSVRVTAGSNTDRIVIYGYTIESRYLRSV